jgi:hypothetical protein
MPDDLMPCDTSVLDELIDAARQESVLEEFRRRAEQNKARVDEAVYHRVMADYATRLKTLAANAAPLRERARAEFDKLRAEYDRIEAMLERARLEKEEVEFRGHIGELEAADLADRLRAPVQTLDECRAGLARLDTHKARFVAAFGSEEALLALPTRRIAEGDPADRARSAARAWVHVSGEGGETAVYALGASARLGREEDNDICLHGRGISRHHAVITATLQGYVLRDLGSQNGTVVNGERIAERTLVEGDQIAVGDGRLRFTLNGAAAGSETSGARPAR